MLNYILQWNEARSENLSPRTHNSYVTYECPVCKKRIKASRDSKVICAVCERLFERIRKMRRAAPPRGVVIYITN